MRRLLWVTCLLGAAGCNCGKPDGALKVVVKVDPTQRASCVVLEVSNGSAVVQSVELVRSSPTVTRRDEMVVGLKKGEFPSDVTFTARGVLATGAGTGCDSPRTSTGEGAGVAATFPASGVTTVEVTLPVPAANLDVDRDGYVGVANGGNDCNDAVAAINPGATEDCAGNVDQDCDGLAGCSDTGCATALICQRTPDRLVFVTGPVTVDARACSPALSVEAQDAMGATVAQQGLPVALSANPSTGVTFYSDTACANAVTTVNINQGETRASFHFRAATGGTTFTATASVIGLTPATQLETITHPVPTQLAFTTPARTQAANACSQAMTVELRDVGGAATQTGAASTVVVAGAPATGLQFFSDSGCTSQLSGSSFSIPVGMSSGTFYARGTRAGAVNLTATVTGLTPATQAMTVTPLAATQLRFVSSAQGIGTATCSAPVTLETQDVYGNASPVPAQTAVTLTAAPPTGFGFFTDAACNTSAGGTVNIAASQSQAVFYFRGTIAGTVVMTASSSVGSDTQNAGIGVGPPAKLTITTAPQTAVVAGTCSGAVTVQSRDVSDNPSNITGNALAVVLTPSPASPIQLFSDAACSAGNVITGTSIPVGNTTATFYFRSTLAGVVNIAVSSTLATGDNQNETIVATTPTVIRFTNAEITTTSTTCAGPFALAARDQYGNPSNVTGNLAVTLTSAPVGVTFFPNAGCAGSGVQFADGTSATTFYARATVATTYQLTAAAGGLGNHQQNLFVDPGPVAQLAFVPASSPLVAGACSGALNVIRQDAQGNPVTTGGQIAVALADDTTSTAFGFFTASDCSGTAINSIDILANASSATVYVTAQRAETVNLTASSAGIATNGTHVLTVSAAGVNRLVFNPTAGPVTAGSCTPNVTVQRQDQYGNPVTTGGALPVTLGHNASGGTFEFFADGGCVAPSVGQVTISAGQSLATLSMRATRAEVVNVTGTNAGVTNGAQFTLTVNPGTATRLAFVPASGNLTAGTCSLAVVIERRDANLNLVTAGNLTVNLGEDTTSVAFGFHDTAGCGQAAVPSVLIPDGSSSVQVYFAAQRAETVNITATGTGITTDGAYTLTVDPAAASQLVFTTTPLTVPVSTCSAVLTVQRQDQYGNAVPVGVNTAVGFADNGTNVDFHLVNTCGDAATPSGTMLGGQSTASFYVISDTAQVDTQLTITVGAFTAQQLVTVAGVPRLLFTTPARSITGGQCTQIITVERQSSAGAPITGGPLTVNLSSNATTNATGGLTFHTDALCGTAGVTSVQIAGGSTSTDLYVRANVAESPTLTAQAGGFTSGTQGLTVTVGPAAKLAFTAPGPQTIASLACSAQVTVQLQDQGGNAVNAGGAGRTVTLAGTGGTNTTFYASATDCNNSANAVTTRAMGSGASTVQFFFKSESTTTTTLTASIDGVPAATNATEVETFTPAAPARLVFTTAAPTVEAGFCQAVNIQRQDALNRPTAPNSATPVTWGTPSPNPAAPLSPPTYFSDNGCTVALGSPFDILANQNSTTVYVKGISGAVTGGNTTGSQAYTLTVSAPTLSPNPTLAFTVLPMVRRGTCTLEANEISTTTSAAPCTIGLALPAAGSIARTFLVFQASASTTDDGSSADNVTCHLNSVSEIICERGAATGAAIPINWQTVTFAYDASAGGVSVQHLSATCSAQPLNVPVTSTPRANSFVLFSSRSVGGTNAGDDFFTAEMTADTNVQVLQPSNGGATCSATANFRLQVVTWANANVARAVTAGGAGAQVTATPASAVVARSFLLHSSRMADVADSSTQMCRFRFSGFITGATALTFDRGCTGSNVGDISWERVELPATASVQQFSTTDNNGGNITITSVDRTRAFALVGGQGPGGAAGGRTTYNGNDTVGSSQVNLFFNSATRFDYARGAGDGNVTFTSYVVQVAP